jgi:hypothetical protein
MKKTFTLLATIALMISAAFAQYNDDRRRDDNYGNNNPRDYAFKNKHDNDEHFNDRGRYSFSEREKNFQIAQINRDYYNRIQSVKNKFFMGRYQKERKIELLQMQREDAIRSVLMRFNDRDNRYHDHDRRD